MRNNSSFFLTKKPSFQVSGFAKCLNDILTSDRSIPEMSFTVEREADLQLKNMDNIVCENAGEFEELKKTFTKLLMTNQQKTINLVRNLGAGCAKALDFTCLRILLIDHGIVKFSSGTSEFCQAMVYLGLYPRHENESPKKAAERLRTGLSHVPLPLRYRQWKIDLEIESQKATAQDMPVKVKKKLALMRKGLNVIEHLLANMPREYPYLNFNRH